MEMTSGELLSASAHKVIGMSLEELREFDAVTVSDCVCKKLALKSIRGDRHALNELKDLITRPVESRRFEALDEMSQSLYEFEDAELEAFFELTNAKYAENVPGGDQK